MMRFGISLLLTLVIGSHAGMALAQLDPSCGSLKNGYGPFDYRTAKKDLEVVEQYHFNGEVESLRAPITGYLGGDLDYTLRAAPNHHRALISMMRLGQRDKTERPFKAHFSVECYFLRGIAFREDDGMVRVIYANYLNTKGRKKEAYEQLEAAAERLKEADANVYYNMGLIYFDLHDYPKSLDYAHKAYGMGFPLPGLKGKLERAGKWKALPVEIQASQVAEPKDSAAPEGGGAVAGAKAGQPAGVTEQNSGK